MTITVPAGAMLEPASGGPARSLVVLFHGYGADGTDLVPLASAWRTVLPDTAFVVPDAPEPCDSYPAGRQWFPLTLRDPKEITDGLANVAPAIDAFLDETLATRGLGNSALALAAFSQGAMIALGVGVRREGPIAGIVSFSGLLTMAPPARGAYPPVLLGHGAMDPLIPAAAMGATERILVSAGVRVEAMLRNGLGHGIDEAEVTAGAHFLAKALGPTSGLGG